ncbi:hypothetical protein [Dyella tabacisoli]|uniref:DUF3828 domain-containing protein n=1 Tax=Dyella tabacisoli TaxID=2282381 RepID=A0A369UQU5_9GAMM|nr:hypothetical protein [Dyella tabacisoli]RDD82425.1 hypothetical protein DVJ77_07735 [Dyella tabacisoli]
MRFHSLRHLLLAFVAVLALAACHNKDKDQQEAAKPGGDTPEAAIQQSIDLIKANDFAGFWKHALPPAEYATLRADWTRPKPEQQPITDEDRAKFAENLRQFTEVDAETKLYAQFKPKLAQMQLQYKDQLPIMIGIVQQIAKTGIDQDKQMGDTQKQQARDVLGVLAPWAQQVPWFDQDKAKQAVGTVVTTARKLGLKSADDTRKLDFDSAMQKYAIGFTGVKQLLGIYGLSVDDSLNSAKVTPMESKDGHARVKIDYTLLGKPLSTEYALVQQDGRWYSEDMLRHVHEAHARLLAPAPSASTPAPAASAAIATKM